jgi:hypothetical protein
VRDAQIGQRSVQTFPSSAARVNIKEKPSDFLGGVILAAAIREDGADFYRQPALSLVGRACTFGRHSTLIFSALAPIMPGQIDECTAMAVAVVMELRKSDTQKLRVCRTQRET